MPRRPHPPRVLTRVSEARQRQHPSVLCVGVLVMAASPAVYVCTCTPPCGRALGNERRLSALNSASCPLRRARADDAYRGMPPVGTEPFFFPRAVVRRKTTPGRSGRDRPATDNLDVLDRCCTSPPSLDAFCFWFHNASLFWLPFLLASSLLGTEVWAWKLGQVTPVNAISRVDWIRHRRAFAWKG